MARHAPVWILIDESTQLGKMPALYDFLPIGRKHRVQILLAAQSIAQLRETHGEHGASVIESLCQLQQYFGPQSLADAEFLSRKLGTVTVPTENERGEVSRPLMTVDELLRLKKRRMIVWTGARNGRPLLLSCRPYWERPMLRFRAAANPYFGRTLPMLPLTLPLEIAIGLFLRALGWLLGPSRTAVVLALLGAVLALGGFDGVALDLPRTVCRLDLDANGKPDLCGWRIPRWR